MARTVLALVLLCVSCAPATNTPAVTTPATTAAIADTAAIPEGFGTLRQDDISLHVRLGDLQVRVTPLDTSIIRVVSPDSYRALRDILSSQATRINEIQRRNGLNRSSLWYVSFYGLQIGETRYSPMEVVITNVGRDFRPIDVIPLSAGFGSQRLRQRDVQHALYVFDGQIDVNQPLALAYETARSSDWGSVLQLVERERALVRSRARMRSSKPNTQSPQH